MPIFNDIELNSLDHQDIQRIEREKQEFAAELTERVLKKLDDISISRVNSSVTVDNLDEIQATLTNELRRLRKSVSKENIKVDVRSHDVRVNNLKDLKFPEFPSFPDFPEKVDIRNINLILEKLDQIEQALGKIPEPQVNVSAPEINIPETEIDIRAILSSLDSNLQRIRNNGVKNPLAVRLSDGKNWLKQIVSKLDGVKTTLAGFSDRVKVVGQNGNVFDFIDLLKGTRVPDVIKHGSKTLTGGATAQLVGTSTPAKYVVITALSTNTDTVWIGGESVTENEGRPLTAGQTSEKIEIDDLSKVYIHSSRSGGTLLENTDGATLENTDGTSLENTGAAGSDKISYYYTNIS